MNLLEADHFSWLGRLPYADMPGLLSAGDLHCSPTYQEGFSNTLVEAAACGLPLLTTDAVGVRDVFRHRQTAWLIPTHSAEAVTESLTTLLGDAPLRQRLASAAQDLVRERFNWPELADAIFEIYAAGLPVARNGTTPPLEGIDPQCRYRQNPLLL